jgi:hypothetical protein
VIVHHERVPGAPHVPAAGSRLAIASGHGHLLIAITRKVISQTVNVSEEKETGFVPNPDTNLEKPEGTVPVHLSRCP